jgi:hypothetical protein
MYPEAPASGLQTQGCGYFNSYQFLNSLLFFSFLFFLIKKETKNLPAGRQDQG